MVKQEKSLARRARQYWEKRDLAALDRMRQTPGAAKNADVLYYAGLAMNALSQRREAIECWRKACDLKPTNVDALRALAFELAEQAPGEAAVLLARLESMHRANADDLTCLGEIRIKQDRLREAHDCLKSALRLEPDNSLALLALASLYAQVHDRAYALEFLKKAADTEEIDLTDLAGDPEFEFLWRDPTFERLVVPRSRKPAVAQ